MQWPCSASSAPAPHALAQPRGPDPLHARRRPVGPIVLRGGPELPGVPRRRGALRLRRLASSAALQAVNSMENGCGLCLGPALKQCYEGLIDRVSLYLPFEPGKNERFWKTTRKEVKG